MQIVNKNANNYKPTMFRWSSLVFSIRAGIPLGHQGRQAVLNLLKKGTVNVIAPHVGIDELPVTANHAGDHGNGVLPALDLYRGYTQVQVGLQLIAQDTRRRRWAAPGRAR